MNIPTVAISIPKIFHQTESGELFRECLLCSKNLLNKNSSYLVEKAYRQVKEYQLNEVIFEYAMCMDCAEKMHSELSEESRSRITNYFQENVNFKERYETLTKKNSRFPEWIKKCVVKKTPLRNSSEYSIYAQCEGKKLLRGIFPYGVGGEAMEEVNMLLSEKTREVLDDFIGRHFSGPPEFAEILKRRPILI